MQPPWQPHRAEHLRPALKHLQLPWHAFLHPYLTRNAQALLLSDKSVQCGTHCLTRSSYFQPYIAKLGITCWGVSDCFQKKLAWRIALFTCWKYAALVGGRFSRVLVPLWNNFKRASFRLEELQDLLHWTIGFLSSRFHTLEFIVNFSGLSRSQRNTRVISGILPHRSHAVFFPILRGCELVSQPVSAWKMRRAWAYICHELAYPGSAFPYKTLSINGSM